jgi:hypothetical protein
MRIIHLVLHILLTMMLILAIFTLGPMLETKYWPVYSHFTVVKARNVPAGLEVTARFTKNRNCAPQGYGWYLGEFGIMKQVITRSSDITVHRPLGNQIGVFTVEELRLDDLDYLYAEVYHHCHPLWLSRSVIYP